MFFKKQDTVTCIFLPYYLSKGDRFNIGNDTVKIIKVNSNTSITFRKLYWYEKLFDFIKLKCSNLFHKIFKV